MKSILRPSLSVKDLLNFLTSHEYLTQGELVNLQYMLDLIRLCEEGRLFSVSLYKDNPDTLYCTTIEGKQWSIELYTKD